MSPRGNNQKTPFHTIRVRKLDKIASDEWKRQHDLSQADVFRLGLKALKSMSPRKLRTLNANT